jgi:hypothetical protein
MALSAPSIPMPRQSLPALGTLLSPATPWLPLVFGFKSQHLSVLVTFRTICKRLFLEELFKTMLMRMADYSNKRGETVMAGLTCHLLGYVFNRIFTEINLKGVRYFGVVWTQTFGTFSHPLNIAWMSLACTDSEERALAMAM